MKKYTILALLVLALVSCGKDVNVDGVKIDTKDGMNVTTEDGSLKVGENGVEMTSSEGSASIWADGIKAGVDGADVSVWADGVKTQTQEWNLELNEEWLQWNIEGAGEMSITNDGIQAGWVNISSWNVAESTIKNAVDTQMNDMDMNMDGLDNMMNNALESN